MTNHWEIELLLFYWLIWVVLLFVGGFIADYFEQRYLQRKEKEREKLYKKVLHL